jgi:hypothetical protein
MRNARSRLLNALTLLSLLLCVAAVALWVRSYVVHDWVYAARGGRALYVHSSAGSITFVSDSGTAGPASAVHWFADRDAMPAGGAASRRCPTSTPARCRAWARR